MTHVTSSPGRTSEASPTAIASGTGSLGGVPNRGEGIDDSSDRDRQSPSGTNEPDRIRAGKLRQVATLPARAGVQRPARDRRSLERGAADPRAIRALRSLPHAIPSRRRAHAYRLRVLSSQRPVSRNSHQVLFLPRRNRAARNDFSFESPSSTFRLGLWQLPSNDPLGARPDGPLDRVQPLRAVPQRRPRVGQAFTPHLQLRRVRGVPSHFDLAGCSLRPFEHQRFVSLMPQRIYSHRQEY